MEKLLIDMLSNAPAVAVLLYLVYRLDARLAAITDKLLEVLENQQRP